MGRTIRISMFLVAFLAVGCSVHERKTEPVRSAAVDSVNSYTDAATVYSDTTMAQVTYNNTLIGTISRQRDEALALAKEALRQRDAQMLYSDRYMRLLVNHFCKQRTTLRMPDGENLELIPSAPKDSLTQVTLEAHPRRFIETVAIDWRTEAARNKPKPGELHRADYAYDAGGVRERGESDGHFRIQDMQVTYQPAGPFGGVIPDTLLIVSPDRGAPVMPGRFTVVDTIFEQYDPPLNTLTMVDQAARTDTTLLVRPH